MIVLEPAKEHEESLVIGASVGALLDIMGAIRKIDQTPPRSTSSKCNTRPHIGAQLYFTNYTLTGQSSKYARDRRQAECHKGVRPLVRDSLRHGRREVDSLTHALSHLLEPRSWIRAVNHAPQEAQPLGCIIAVPTDVVLRDLGV